MYYYYLIISLLFFDRSVFDSAFESISEVIKYSFTEGFMSQSSEEAIRVLFIAEVRSNFVTVVEFEESLAFVIQLQVYLYSLCTLTLRELSPALEVKLE